MIKIMKIALVVLLLFAVVASPFAAAVDNADKPVGKKPVGKVERTIKVADENKTISAGYSLKISGKGNPNEKLIIATKDINNEYAYINSIKRKNYPARVGYTIPDSEKVDYNSSRDSVDVDSDGVWEKTIKLAYDLSFPTPSNVQVCAVGKAIQPVCDSFTYTNPAIKMKTPEVNLGDNKNGYHFINQRADNDLMFTIPNPEDEKMTGKAKIVFSTLSGITVVENAECYDGVCSYTFPQGDFLGTTDAQLYIVASGRDGNYDTVKDNTGKPQDQYVADELRREDLQQSFSRIKKQSKDDIFYGPINVKFENEYIKIPEAKIEGKNVSVKVLTSLANNTKIEISLSNERKINGIPMKETRTIEKIVTYNTPSTLGTNVEVMFEFDPVDGEYTVNAIATTSEGFKVTGEKKFTYQQQGSPTPNKASPKSPGFTIALALIGLGAVAFIAMRRR